MIDREKQEIKEALELFRDFLVQEIPEKAEVINKEYERVLKIYMIEDKE